MLTWQIGILIQFVSNGILAVTYRRHVAGSCCFASSAFTSDSTLIVSSHFILTYTCKKKWCWYSSRVKFHVVHKS